MSIFQRAFFVAVAVFSSVGLAGMLPLSSHALRGQCDSGVNAFGETVFAKMVKDCKECHGGGPTAPEEAPYFLKPEVDQSYYRIRNYVDFSNIEESKLAKRAGNNHCGKPNCNSASGTEMIAQIQAWWENGQKDCADFGTFFTPDVEVPELPMQATDFKTLEWDLGGISSSLEGNFFQVEIKRFANPTPETRGAYYLQKPRIKGVDKAIRIKDVKVLVNRKYDIAANAFTFIDKTVTRTQGDTREAAPYGVLSSDYLIVLQDLAEGDKLSISFETIEKTAMTGCKDEATFSSLILPHFDSFKCYSCHAGGTATAPGTSPANTAFSMALDTTTLCRSVRDRLNLDQFVAVQSPMVSMPVAGRIGHPVVVDKPDLYMADIEKWFALER